MTSISASTTVKVRKNKAPSIAKAPPGKKGTGPTGPSLGMGRPAGKKAVTKAKAAKGGKRSIAPKLRPDSLSTAEAAAALRGLGGEELSVRIADLVHAALGERAPFREGLSRPHTASNPQARSAAAADVAVACRELGLVQVLKRHGVLARVEANLIPLGLGALFGNEDGTNYGGGMNRIASAVSLASMASADSDSAAGLTSASFYTGASDSKRGKAAPSDAREGSLLIVRALCEIVGKAADPFVVPLLAAALDECGSSTGSVREAAADAAVAVVANANPIARSSLIVPIIFEALESPDWRVKESALERLVQCAELSPDRISPQLPMIIPSVTPQVWDTKVQVQRAAKAAILACCHTNLNPDIKPAIPAIVNAIVKPADVMKAVEELKGTTFVAEVDAATLSILCPILSRGLKEKQALSKRSCCIVIENMSRLVETPNAVAPFGPLLVPELKKVAENVSFDEIRDVALAALKALTKALGHSSVDDAVAAVMAKEAAAAEEEQNRIAAAKEDEERRERELKLKEEEERRQWKEAMEAQRLLDNLELEAEQEKKKADVLKKDRERRSVKGGAGKCQGCGLKKCKKSCLFYS